MSNDNELGVAERWIYGRLSGDAELTALVGENIYQDSIPDDGPNPYPAVLFLYQRGQDVRGNGPRRYMTDVVYIVKVVGRAPKSSLRAIATRIDAALNGQSSDAVASCTRIQPLSFPEREGDTLYQHIGGFYRLQIVPSVS